MELNTSIAPLSQSEVERISKYVRDAQEHIYGAQGQIYKAQGCLNDIENFLSARSRSEAKTSPTPLDNIATTTEARQGYGTITSGARENASSEAALTVSGSVSQTEGVEVEFDALENDKTGRTKSINDRKITRPPRFSITKMTDEQQAFLRSQLSYTKMKKDAIYFLQPVDPVALKLPTYPSVIKQPMDLATIDTKLKRNEYPSVQAFVDDVQLIVDNAMKFNGANHAITHAAYGMMTYVHERLKKYAIKRQAPRDDSKLHSK